MEAQPVTPRQIECGTHMQIDHQTGSLTEESGVAQDGGPEDTGNAGNNEQNSGIKRTKKVNLRPLSEWLSSSRSYRKEALERKRKAERGEQEDRDNKRICIHNEAIPKHRDHKSHHLELQPHLTIMSLNVYGVRTKQKLQALGEYISSLTPQPDICVLVETHLFENEEKRVRVDTYVTAHQNCRKIEDAQQACGEVLILVKKGLHHIKKDDLPELSQPLNSCTIQIFPNSSRVEELRITGVYLQPAAKPRFADVSCLTGTESRNYYKQKQVGHIICGDFNHPSWKTGFGEWIGEHGIWILTDPTLRTYASGNSLDKFLYLPGDEIPSNFLMEQVPAHEDWEGEAYYPGVTIEKECVGNHHPIFLSIPVREEKGLPFIRRMKTNNVT